ncbi:histidine-rich glycoprotein-like [Anopheles nili]|uniref:histidine-rich glycoprotein-like n=1 Tax=Anopheles nili TaxID=185578 RepID=UPI00237A6397|nr:histidine-rich glycoprotein-like [Anopheles nili]
MIAPSRAAPAARQVRRSADEPASSYFFFSRSPGHAIEFTGTPLGELPKVLPSLTEIKHHIPTLLGEDHEDDDEHGAVYRVEEHDHEDDDDGEEREEHGSAYDVGHHAKKGVTSDKGYDEKHSHERGRKGSYGKEHHENQYANGADRSHSHHDEGSHHRDHHAAAHRTKGGKHHEKKHHKKGSKTTGYHNVFHKDEYKKEHVFYDTSDHSGQFKKYGSAHEHHGLETGQHASGGHENRAHREGGHKKSGGSQHGAYDEHQDAFRHQHGRERHNKDGSSYGHSGAAERGYQIIHP